MEEKQLIDLSDFADRLYKAFLKLWKLILVFTLLCSLLYTLKGLIRYHATYTSSMSVIVSQQNNNILVTSESTEKTNEAFKKALLSTTMQKIIANDLKMSYVPASIQVSLVPDTNILKVSATSSNPEDAYRVVNSIASNYGQLTKQMNDANMIILEEAKMPVSVDNSIGLFRLLIKGALMGLAISLFVTMIYAFTRRTILREDHIKNKLHLKVLGSVPKIGRKKKNYPLRNQLLITNNRISTAYKDAFRPLTMRIEREKNQKVIMITSTLPNEGKSTLSANIALSLAQNGKKVVLVDLDLRNPSLFNIFKIENTKDEIGNYIDSKCVFSDIITSSEQHENLDLVIGFKSYDNSIEMLSRQRCQRMITELKKKYDYVILDVPPLLIMQDAISISRFCDSALLVIRQDYAKVYEIVEALDEYYEVNRNVMGCILNCVEESVFDEDFKGYEYGYSYGKRS